MRSESPSPESVAPYGPARLWSWVSIAARMLALGATLPWIVTRLDAAEVALWYLFATVMALQLIADLGLSSVFARFYSYALGGAAGVGGASDNGNLAAPAVNWPLIQRILATARPVYAGASLLWLVLLGAVGAWSVTDLVAQSGNSGSAWIACAVVAVATAIRLYGNTYTSFLFGMGRIADWRKWEAIVWVAIAVAGVAVLEFGGRLLQLTVVTQGLVCAGVGVNSVLTRNLMRSATGHGPGHARLPDHEILAEAWPRAWRAGLGITMHTGVMHALGLLVARLESPAHAASYLLAYNVARAIDQFAQVPFYTTLPELAGLRVQRRDLDLVELAQHGIRNTFWLLVAGLAGAGIVLPWLLTLIGSRIDFLPADFWALMCLAVFVERFGANHMQLHMTTNQVVLHVANGVTGLIIAVLVAASYGRVGMYAIPASQLAAGLLWFGWYSARKSHATIGVPAWQFERSTSLVPLMFLVAFLMISVRIAQ